MIAPLPVAVGSVKWRAETRGSTVVLLMDPQAKMSNWAGQLGIIFTHELLHLWVPNSLRLKVTTTGSSKALRFTPRS